MFEFLSDIMRYIFITIIYYFMFSIIRLIAQDIKNGRMGTINDDQPFIKPLCIRSKVDFKIDELYTVKDGCTIGRGKRADIMISDQFMSAKQARFICETNDEWLIEDLGSTNGTFVNNEQLSEEPCAIKTGDIIKMGQLSYIFVQPGEE
ncbi:MAG: FHA domain-containing protein [Clostridia bacterium]|nr:FHA domain-containing protein [Clostridia bacterium]